VVLLKPESAADFVDTSVSRDCFGQFSGAGELPVRRIKAHRTRSPGAVHSRSTLVDQVYAHSLQSGMASVAERVTALALGEQPKLRVI
jgi:hypothetical protein